MIQSLGYFIYAIILDLSIGYYHLSLYKESSNLYSICPPVLANTNTYLRGL